MTPDDAFLHDIIESPEDDTSRLIYADYLDERGDPRGEFIRVQIELARLPQDHPRRQELAARERQLYQKKGTEWTGPLRAWAGFRDFRRGFVECINLAVEDFLEHTEIIFLAAPVRHATFTRGRHGFGQILARLGACSSLNRRSANWCSSASWVPVCADWVGSTFSTVGLMLS